MQFHAIIHAPFETLGAIENWILEKGHSLSVTHSYQGEQLPEPSQFDFLILMGGPQSPLQLDKFPYLAHEIELCKKAIQANKIVLGICLGAQIIGESLGAKTGQSPNKEIGVYPIQVTKEGELDPLFKQFPKQFAVMHWHNDMPGLTKETVLLAQSEGCPRQAFRYGDRVYGFQFHLEMTSELVNGMIKHSEPILPGRYVQSASELMQANFSPINQKIYLALDYLADIN